MNPNPANLAQSPEEAIAQMKAQVTSPDSLRMPQLVELPSNLKVMIERVNHAALIRLGKIPNHLVSLAYRILEGSEKEGYTEKTEEEQTKILSDVSDTMDYFMAAIVVYPKIVMTREEEEADRDAVWVGHYSEQDKVVVYRLAQARSSTLDTFRPGRGGSGSREDSRKISRPSFRRRETKRGVPRLWAV